MTATASNGTPTVNKGLRDLATELRLVPAEEETYFGRYLGFPIAISLLEPTQEIMSLLGVDSCRSPLPSLPSTGLLIQIRHCATGESLPDRHTILWGDELSELIEQKKARLEIEDRIAWMTLYDVGEQLAAGRVETLLSSALTALTSASVSAESTLCHYCMKRNAPVLTYLKGRVCQMCDQCLEQRADKQAQWTRLTGKGLSMMLASGCECLIASGFVWALCWRLYAWVLNLIPEGREGVMVPDVILIAFVAVVSVCVGGCAGLIIRRIPERGDTAAGGFAALYVVIGVLLGEFGLGFYMAYAATGHASVLPTVRAIAQYWYNAGGMHAIIKLGAVAGSIAVAYGIARPRPVPLDL